MQEEIRESDLEGMQNVLAPDNELLNTDEDIEQKEMMDATRRNLEKEEGFMSSSNLSGEI
jgi:hypothetical protein